MTTPARPEAEVAELREGLQFLREAVGDLADLVALDSHMAIASNPRLRALVNATRERRAAEQDERLRLHRAEQERAAQAARAEKAEQERRSRLGLVSAR